MCGRLASSLPPEAIRALFRTTGPSPNLGPSWNVAPSQPAMVIRRHPGTGDRHLDLLRWGLIPSLMLLANSANGFGYPTMLRA